ncbi:MAG: SbcC/MukB-like Walker B domain-containing protein, partial [Bacteroidaceae bacterium]|nr:SbcC/MukB-like Walker B domain-containing protein [Bacteroidaceae bacterium]
EQFAEQQKPLLDRARVLDLRIATGRQVTQEAQQVYTHAVEDLEKRKSTIRSMQTAQAKLEKEQTTISHWMLQHKPYEPLIPRVELLESYVTNVQYVRQQLQQNKTFLQEAEKRLAHRRRELEQLTAEAERLNQLLPAEIVVLRKKLEAGKPCPVCGSLQHCVNTVEMESLQEAELNKQKNAVQKRTDIVKKELEQLEAGKQHLCSSIESDTTHLKDGMDKLSTSLAGLPAWKDSFAAGTLIKMLQDIATQWNRFMVEELAIKEKLTTIHSQLTVHLAAVEKESELVVKQKELWRGKQQQLQQLETERAALFAGKTVQAMEQELKMERNRRATLLTTQTELQTRWKGSWESCKGAKKELLATGERLKQSILSLQKTVNDWMGQQEIVESIEELTQLLEKESGWLAAERAALDALREQKTVTQTTLQEKRERYKKQQEQPIQPTEEETASHLALLLKANKEQVEQLSNRNITIKLAFEKDIAGKERIQAFEKELEKLQQLAENWKKLNDLFGSADGAKFKVLAQGYTLDVLLSYANKHLHELSKRYELQRIPNSLALQVVDLDMLGEIRTVHSLSGGESFLISLALALGLSSLSSNRMHVESLFIDEGFGSLDVDTLRVAMDALEHLQTQGRKIGVISHVAEMTEHITTQIRVIKTANGRSKIEVI